MKRGVVIIPACNEAPSLEHFLPRLQGAIRQLDGLTIDIFVIDDGSTDNTARVVQEKKVKSLRSATNQGLGLSLRRGYAYAVEGGYDFLVSMDSDGQHDPNVLAAVIEQLRQGADLVTASRYHPESERFRPPIDRDLLNIAFTAIIHATTGWKHISDPLTGFWAMHQHVAKFLAENLKLERYGTCLEGLVKLWHLMEPRPKLIEVPHPAIYTNAGSGFLNRVYSPANLEDRIDRFGTHALHVIRALQDVQAAGKEVDVDQLIADWRIKMLGFWRGVLNGE